MRCARWALNLAVAAALAGCGDASVTESHPQDLSDAGGLTAGDATTPDGGGSRPDGGPRPDAGTTSPDGGACSLGTEPCAWLAAHNAVRCAVSPTAVSMPKLDWDEKLVCVAQQYADTCPDGHNANREAMYKACGGSGYVGENLGWGYASISAVVNAWAAEKSNYDYASNTCAAGKMCGHYTQIVWAKTLRIGCARAKVSCPDWQGKYWVCNYAPGGNYVGQKPYVAGSGANASCQ